MHSWLNLALTLKDYHGRKSMPRCIGTCYDCNLRFIPGSLTMLLYSTFQGFTFELLGPVEAGASYSEGLSIRSKFLSAEHNSSLWWQRSNELVTKDHCTAMKDMAGCLSIKRVHHPSPSNLSTDFLECPLYNSLLVLPYPIVVQFTRKATNSSSSDSVRY